MSLYFLALATVGTLAAFFFSIVLACGLELMALDRYIKDTHEFIPSDLLKVYDVE